MQVYPDLDVSGKAGSTSQGVFMGAVSALPTPSSLAGGVVFNTTDNKHYYSNGSAWSVLDIVAGKDSDGATFSTKYATKTELNNGLTGKQNTLTFDSAPTSGSTNPVTSGGVFSAINTVSEAVEDKMDKMTVDSVPTSGSNNLVTSGGVYTAINNSSGSSWEVLWEDSTGLSNISLSSSLRSTLMSYTMLKFELKGSTSVSSNKGNDSSSISIFGSMNTLKPTTASITASSTKYPHIYWVIGSIFTMRVNSSSYAPDGLMITAEKYSNTAGKDYSAGVYPDYIFVRELPYAASEILSEKTSHPIIRILGQK